MVAREFFSFAPKHPFTSKQGNHPDGLRPFHPQDAEISLQVPLSKEVSKLGEEGLEPSRC